jgi:hypothetical protein
MLLLAVGDLRGVGLLHAHVQGCTAACTPAAYCLKGLELPHTCRSTAGGCYQRPRGVLVRLGVDVVVTRSPCGRLPSLRPAAINWARSLCCCKLCSRPWQQDCVVIGVGMRSRLACCLPLCSLGGHAGRSFQCIASAFYLCAGTLADSAWQV